jgi:prepilin-type N-terminal cleavage/methylation domain-containing protein
MKTKINKSKKDAFTLIELLVVISIIAILAALAIPGVTGALTKGQLVQALSNSRQIHLAVQTAALDKATAGVGIGWPGNGDPNTGAPYADAPTYVKDLITNGAIAVGDLKIFTTVGYNTAVNAAGITAANIGFHIYMVSEADEGSTVFLTTKNLNYSPTTEPALQTGVSFGNKGCVIFRKGGDGSFYNANQLKQPKTEDARKALFGTEVSGTTKYID